jgi:hypothetical protein
MSTPVTSRLVPFVRHCGIFAIVFAAFGTCWADTDPQAVLNSLLAGKPSITRMRTIKVTHVSCNNPSHGHAGGGCQTWYTTEQQTYPDIARVVNAQVIQVSTVQYDEAHMVSLPSIALFDESTYYNCTDGEYIPTLSLTVSGQYGWGVSKTHSIGSTTTVNLGGTFPLSLGANGLPVAGGPTFNMSMSQSITLSDSTTSSESHSETVTRQDTDQKQIPGNSTSQITIVAYQLALDVPFSATVIIDGNMEDNTSGYTKASDLLSAAQRTITFDGTMHLKGVTEKSVLVVPAPLSCTDPKLRNGTGLFEQRSWSTPVRHPVDGFVMQAVSDEARRDHSALLRQDPTGAHDDYQVLARTTVIKSAGAQCGRDTTGKPMSGLFYEEMRNYFSGLDAADASPGQRTVDLFQRCVSSP